MTGPGEVMPDSDVARMHLFEGGILQGIVPVVPADVAVGRTFDCGERRYVLLSAMRIHHKDGSRGFDAQVTPVRADVAAAVSG